MAVKPKKKRKEAEGEETGEGGRKRKRHVSDGRPKPTKKRPGDEGYDPYDFTSSESEGEEPAPPTTDPHSHGEAMDTSAPAQLSNDRSVTLAHYKVCMSVLSYGLYSLAEFRSKVGVAFSDEHAQSLPVSKLTEVINASCHDNPFSANEVSAGLVAMEEANQVMVSEGVVFLI